jgi:hypothetical protein
VPDVAAVEPSAAHPHRFHRPGPEILGSPLYIILVVLLMIDVVGIESRARNRSRRSLIPRYDRQWQERIVTPRKR